jgi:integrase
MASTGLRVSEAIHLRDADVDLKRGMLTIRQTKFAKSRQLPIHPSTVEALARYRRERVRHLPIDGDMPFLISSRGRRLGQPLGDRQAHRVFTRCVTASAGSIAARTMRRACTTCATPLPSGA